MRRAIAVLAVVLLAASDAPLYRGDFLAISPTALALRGGTTLRVAPSCTCAHDLRAGESVVFALDANAAVTTLHRFSTATDGRPFELKDLPVGAALAVAGAGAADVVLAKVTITVEVPTQTPQSDDIYLSTERSGYTPNERRMNRIDERRWSLAIEGPTATVLHYQYTRGSFATLERDRTNNVRPARTIVFGTTPAQVRDAVERWADIL